MAGDWFCRIGGTKHGPYTPQQLKALVAAGKLHPDDLVRHGPEGPWVAAQRVKGLFAEAAPQGSTPAKSGLKKAKSITPPGVEVRSADADDEVTVRTPIPPRAKKPVPSRERPDSGRKIQLIAAAAIGVVVLLVLIGAGLWQWLRPSTPPQKPEPAVAQKPEPEPEPEAKPAPKAEPKPAAEPIAWHKAGEPVTLKDEEVTVKMQSVMLANLAHHGFASDKKCLLVMMKVENGSATRKIDFEAWGKVSPSYPAISLADEHGKKYKLFLVQVNGPKPSIYPQQSLVDNLFFERPIDSAQTLKLVLPATAVGAKGWLNFEIPRSAITVEPPPKVAAPKPADDISAPGKIDLDQPMQVKTFGKPEAKGADKLFDGAKSEPKLTDLLGMPAEKEKPAEKPAKKGPRRSRP